MSNGNLAGLLLAILVTPMGSLNAYPCPPCYNPPLDSLVFHSTRIVLAKVHIHPWPPTLQDLFADWKDRVANRWTPVDIIVEQHIFPSSPSISEDTLRSFNWLYFGGSVDIFGRVQSDTGRCLLFLREGEKPAKSSRVTTRFYRPVHRQGSILVVDRRDSVQDFPTGDDEQANYVRLPLGDCVEQIRASIARCEQHRKASEFDRWRPNRAEVPDRNAVERSASAPAKPRSER